VFVRFARLGLLTVVITFVFAECAFAQGYGGPSILSRGGNRPGRRGRTTVGVSAYVGVRGTVDTGITPVVLDDNGTVASTRLTGVQIEAGAYGSRSWRRSSFGMDYRGDYRHTTPSRGYNGTNQALALDYRVELNRRVTLFAMETGGTTNRAFGGFAAPVTADPLTPQLVNNEVFDARSYFSQTTAGLAYRRSARTTLTGMGGAFFVKRSNPRLVGTAGAVATGGVDYRLNSRSSVNLTYVYMQFDFKRTYGQSRIHGFTAGGTRRFGRNWDGTISLGMLRAQTAGTRAIELSPEVAAILGRTQGVAAFNDARYMPQGQAALTYTLEHSRFNVSASQGISPGNGVFQTSTTRSVTAGYSYSGIRKLSLGASAGYLRYGSIGLNFGELSTYRAGGGLNYALMRTLNFSTQLDYRKFDTVGIPGRNGYALAIGLMFSPGRFPLAIW
jgi:hypothetical protein